jgi:chaperonin GroES
LAYWNLFFDPEYKTSMFRLPTIAKCANPVLLTRRFSATSLARRITPLGNRVLVQKATVAKQTTGGIMIPDSAVKNELNEATVVAVGPGKNEKGILTPCAVKVDDRVLLPDYGGVSLKQGDDEFVLLKDEEILAKLD